MIELQTHIDEQGQRIHVDTHEIHPGEMPVLFLTENLGVNVICNVPNRAGKITLTGDLEQVLRLDLCSRDEKSGDLVKIRPLKPNDEHIFTGQDVIRLRYRNPENEDDIIEEVIFALKDQLQTTDRMRRMQRSA